MRNVPDGSCKPRQLILARHFWLDTAEKMSEGDHEQLDSLGLASTGIERKALKSIPPCAERFSTYCQQGSWGHEGGTRQPKESSTGNALECSVQVDEH